LSRRSAEARFLVDLDAILRAAGLTVGAFADRRVIHGNGVPLAQVIARSEGRTFIYWRDERFGRLVRELVASMPSETESRPAGASATQPDLRLDRTRLILLGQMAGCGGEAGTGPEGRYVRLSHPALGAFVEMSEPPGPSGEPTLRFTSPQVGRALVALAELEER
jgi:hypothetical protein